MKNVLLLLFLISPPIFAQRDIARQESLQQKTDRMRWWSEGRFGMFIHWGPVSLEGTEISWSRGGERRGIEGKGEIPVEIYDSLYKKFNPVQFNANEWVSIAHSAGMKYMVLTAKHCDGFCLWRSKVDDYNIGNSPFGRDVCGELATAAHDSGMRIGWYYSAMDWRDPDCRTDRNDIYVKKMQGHLRELLGTYGRIDVLWFDADGGPIPWDQDRTYGIVRELQPHLVINDRLWLGKYADRYPELIDQRADYKTPEQRVGVFQNRIPWETCMTLGTQWSWKPNDKIKSYDECVRILVQCATGDGNLLLNVGPMPDGRIEPRQVVVLKQIGSWLDKYGESIYGTRGGPFKNGTWGGSTRNADVAYIHIAQWDGDELLLPPIAASVRESNVLTGGVAKVSQSDRGIEILMPSNQHDRFDTIIKLRFDRSIDGIDPVEVERKDWIDTTGIVIRMTSEPDSPFMANGAKLLLDGVRGTTDRTDGKWLGFLGNDFEVSLDLQRVRRIGRIDVGCLQEQVSSIFFPESVAAFASDDGVTFRPLGNVKTGQPIEDAEIKSHDYTISFEPTSVRYMRIKATNIGTCPAWHSNKDGKAWLFVDEILLK